MVELLEHIMRSAGTMCNCLVHMLWQGIYSLLLHPLILDKELDRAEVIVPLDSKSGIATYIGQED